LKISSFFLWLKTRPGLWLSYLTIITVSTLGFFFFRFPLNFTRVIGRHNIPKKGRRVLFVSNHVSMYDSFLIGISAFFPSMLTHPARPPINFAARENFFTTWYISLFFRLLRTVPVEGRKDSKLLKRYQSLIEENNLLIFYQGGRSDDLEQIKDGPGYLIATVDEPIAVIPVFHKGIERIFTRGGPKTKGIWRWLPRSLFRKPVVIFGPAIDFSEELKISELREKIKAINQKIIACIQALQLTSQETLRT
jgi:1-acyl-sn-glycerol-3-phosphate acyltransferase